MSGPAYSKHEVPASCLLKWELSINLLAQILLVPAALIMRVDTDTIEVLVRSQSNKNPYKPGEQANLGTGLYCEAVMASGKLLKVPFAPDDPKWVNNPDIELNMNSYMGVPLHWPDGSVFGTLCVLDEVKREYSILYEKMLIEFKQLIERDFKIINHELELEKNIKELNDINQALDISRQNEQQANLKKSEFLAFISHEIRTSMNGVLGMSLLLQDTELTDIQQGYTDIINTSSDTLLTLLNDILDYSKIEAGQLDLTCAAFDLDRLILDLVEFYKKSTDQSVIRIFYEPAADTNMWFLGDSVRIRQILSNLISNSVKFTTSGEVIICLAIEAEEHLPNTYRVKLSVADTGCGISEEDQKRVFNDYVQVGRSLEKMAKGTGLGLSICKKLTQLMGGTISVNSQVGLGATFVVSLPLTRAYVPELVHSKLDQNQQEITTPLRILVAEDNDVNTLVLKGFLTKLHQSATFTRNGYQTITVFKKALLDQPFDLIFMDCEMPVLDGCTATKIIREYETLHHLPRIPIVAISAHAEEEFVDKTLGSGMNCHLAKPIQINELIQTLAQFTA